MAVTVVFRSAIGALQKLEKSIWTASCLIREHNNSIIILCGSHPSKCRCTLPPQKGEMHFSWLILLAATIRSACKYCSTSEDEYQMG
jgi:hypothetical protein